MVKCEIRAAKIEPLYDYLEDKENAPRGWAPDGNTAPAEKEALRGIYLMKPAYLDRITSYNVCYTKLLRAGAGAGI